TAGLGDTIEVEVWMDVGQTEAQGVSFYLTIDEVYFECINLLGNEEIFIPFDFSGGLYTSGIFENGVHPDSNNVIPGLQINGGALLSNNWVSGKGKLARFRVVTKKHADSTAVVIDYDRVNFRDTRYFLYSPEGSHPFITVENLEVSIGEVTGIEEVPDNPVPDEFRLCQNYPNPFNLETTIGFYLPYSNNIKVNIYNILGQEVKALGGRTFGSGYNTIRWNGKNNFGYTVPSGMYIYKIEGAGFSESKRMVLLK
ncbi:T9SS type A sorting domain-containing protein, partial [candidate division KSB1 bacterium]